jgi:hypothetical protein
VKKITRAVTQNPPNDEDRTPGEVLKNAVGVLVAGVV